MSAISSPTRPSVQPTERTSHSRSPEAPMSGKSSALTTEQQVKFLQLAAEIESLLVAVQAKKQQQSQSSQQ
ncbi:hypothetical protein [Geitlerinema sp. PCC 9228]|uniref:hypothetical protein n=1 Tax=Geitlerinema sp. PCC 9228 TaxID=111611 RepID=UPI001114BBD9|nr:hypothetical protein [Geitlerinema sp. PCC 9228]